MLAYMSFPTEHWLKIHSTDEIDKRLLRPRVAKRGASLQAPPGVLFVPCRIEALARPVLRWTRSPGAASPASPGRMLLWLEALFRYFDNRRHLASYAGLVLTP